MPSCDAEAGGTGPTPVPSGRPRRALRVVLADDHSLVRDSVRRLLDGIANLEVVGEATDGLQAVALAKALSPDLVLMDVHMPGLDGIEATRRIRSETPHTRVIILTSHDEPSYVKDAHLAGAAAYLLKGQPDLDIAVAIEKAFS